MLPQAFQSFIDRSPICVMARAVLENLFRPEWQTQGIAAIKLAAFGPYRDATLWVSHFAT